MMNNTMKKIFLFLALLAVIFSANVFAETVWFSDKDDLQSFSALVQEKFQTPNMAVTRACSCTTYEEVEKVVPVPLREFKCLLEGNGTDGKYCHVLWVNNYTYGRKFILIMDKVGGIYAAYVGDIN